MGFDLEGARRDGYSDTEIADHLSSKFSFDLEGARTGGYSDTEIIDHLSQKEAGGLFAEAGQEFRRGAAERRAGELKYRRRFEGGLSPEEEAALARASFRMEQPYAEDDGFISKVVKGGAEMLGQQVETGGLALERGLQGAISGATAAAVAGQIGPQIVTPEEIVTVPAAAIAGFGAGFAGGITEAHFRASTGHKAEDLLAAGVSPDVADIAAGTYGLAEGILETGGVAILAAPFKKLGKEVLKKGANELIEMAGRATVKGALKSALIAQAKSQGGEIATEVMQEAADAAVDEVVGNIENIPELQGSLSPDQLVPRMMEIAEKTFYATVIPGLGGAGATYVGERRGAPIVSDAPTDLTGGDGGPVDAATLEAAQRAHTARGGLSDPSMVPPVGAIPLRRTTPAMNVPLQPTPQPAVEAQPEAPAPTPEEAPPPVKPQGVTDYGPEYDAAYQETLDAGAQRGQAHQIGLEASEDERASADLREEAIAAGIPKSMVKEADPAELQEFLARGEQPTQVTPDVEAAELPEVAPATDIDAAAHEAASSPVNEKAEPTEKQIEAGNYEKGHKVIYPGIDVSFENPAGSVRRGTDAKGNAWETELKDHYGYIKRTEAADGEQIDVFVPEGFVPSESDPVFVVDQQNEDGSFDEHKVIFGAKTEEEARDIYLRNYDEKGPSLIKEVSQFDTVTDFKQWLREGDTKAPVAEAAAVVTDIAEKPVVEKKKEKPKAEAAPKKAEAKVAPKKEKPTPVKPKGEPEVVQKAKSVVKADAKQKLEKKSIKRIERAIERSLPRGLDLKFLIKDTLEGEATLTKSEYKAQGIEPGTGRIAGRAETRIFSDGQVRNIITLALDAATEATGYHEIFHIAENLGLLTAKEMEAINRVYGDGPKSLKEARADAYGNWVQEKRRRPPAKVQAIFKKIKEFFEKLGNTLRGLGFTSADEVFAALASGQLARREYNIRKAGADKRYSLVEDPDPTPAQEEQKETLRDRVNTLIDQVDRAIASPLMALEESAKFMARRYRALGTLGEIKEVTDTLYQSLKGAKGEDAKAIYDYLTDAEASVESVPAQWREAAAKAKATVMNVGDRLVAAKLLPEDVVEENRGRYLPRVYLKYLIGEDAAKSMGAGKALNLSYTKKRNKNMTEEERIAKGEITDPAYLVSRAYSIPMRDMAILDWLTDIAKNSKWVSPAYLVEWSWKENPGYQLGQWSYDINDDDTYNLERTERKIKTYTHENVKAADIEKLLGSDRLATSVREGKGKAFLRKRPNVDEYVKTGWYGLGKWYRYKKNADGTYTVKAREVIETPITHENVQSEDLGGLVGKDRAETITEHADGRRTAEVDPAKWNDGKGQTFDVGRQVRGAPKLKGGSLVSVFWLATEAKRIRHTIPSMNEEQQVSAAKIASRMEALVAEYGPEDLENPPMPEGYTQIPQGKKYGPLGGMVVRKEIAEDIVGTFRNMTGDKTWVDGLSAFTKKAMRTWKWAKTAANVSGQVRNFVSNGVMLGLSGVGWHRVVPLMVRAAKEMRTNGQHWRTAKRFGVTEASFANAELMRVETELKETLRKQSGDKSFLSSFSLWFGKFENVTGDVYQLMEALGKTAKIIDAMERQGMTEEEAALEAHKWLFDYSEVRQSVRQLRESPLGMPFLTYSLKVLPRLLDSAVNHPGSMLPLVGITAALPYIISELLMDIDEDEYDKLMKAMPGWIQEKGHTYILPVKDDQGRWKVIDIGYFFPWSQWYDAMRTTGRIIGEDREFKDVVDLVQGMGVMGSPVYDIIGAIESGGVDPFTQRQIIDEFGTPGEKATDMFMYMYNMAMPSWLGSNGFLGKEINALTGELDRQGRPKATHAEAMARLVGINIYGYDPVETREWQITDLERKIVDAKKALKRRLSDPNLSDAAAEVVIEDLTARMDRIAEKLEKYAEESDSELLYR